MIHNLLAVVPETNFVVALAILLFYVCIITLVVICLLRIIKYFSRAGKEQQLIRMELGKVAEEVRLIREQLKGESSKKSSPKSPDSGSQ